MEKEKLSALLKNKHILRLCIILFIGVILMSVGSLHSKKTQPEPSTQPMQQPYAETERRLEAILGKIKGVGEVDVMLTYDGTGKRAYVTDVNREQARDENKTSSAEERSVVLPDDMPVLEAEVYPRVRGVIAVAQGAQSASVREQIILALKAVLEVEEHRIGVFAR